MVQTHGDRRRREILAAAVDLGSAEGLAGLSIGRLADETGMSKSGLFAHFGSKQELQLATVRFAGEGYQSLVIAPSELAEPGLPRLTALMKHWLGYIEGTSYRGGCFFDAASAEFSSRPGPVRDLLAHLSRHWLDRLEEQARLALRLGELAADVDPALLCFRLHACVAEANWARELFDDGGSFDQARRAIALTLRESAPPDTPTPKTGRST